MKKTTKLLIGIVAMSILLINVLTPLEKISQELLSFIIDVIKLDEVFQLFLPWIIFLGLVFVFSKLYQSAQKRKTAAFVFGACVHTFLPPDPKAGMTIEVKQQEERQSKKQMGNNGENGEK